jgi:MerR family transcriptional regulator, copper efflux regulator
MTIGKVASAACVSIDTLRFYERQGLLGRPRRNFSGYREYPEAVLEQLRFIRDAKELGFTLREIRELLSMGVRSTRECGPVTRKAEARLAALDGELRKLRRMRRTLARMVRDCAGACAQCPDCRAGRPCRGG